MLTCEPPAFRYAKPSLHVMSKGPNHARGSADAMFVAGPDKEDVHYMRRALELARLAAGIPGAAPIACMIVRSGQILAEGHNEVDIRHDSTAHAEIVAMQRAGGTLGTADLRGATLYSTLQPCGLCSMASIWSKSPDRLRRGTRGRAPHVF